ncbi:hypothetical protein MPTK1_2g22930 [Marchantia polymorpha subsp. ruderalis]|uniref:Uncharacterized protein n=1 Tax=Marchantia polymorpha TaxID=3197 RepID=A0A2R6WN61_MARPO|nr:hypothetical protein MARPO_0072s0038 [Marchantia polymorpha]BBN03360.1 hypothetical protein Mp_2g22930 [Marchantia polymorpha subsp. ruderalis]|eukprot:PTQ35291.1 hypothetical protein MARPO_0072s0038 [Marchantia polymorpha]
MKKLARSSWLNRQPIHADPLGQVKGVTGNTSKWPMKGPTSQVPALPPSPRKQTKPGQRRTHRSERAANVKERFEIRKIRSSKQRRSSSPSAAVGRRTRWKARPRSVPARAPRCGRRSSALRNSRVLARRTESNVAGMMRPAARARWTVSRGCAERRVPTSRGTGRGVCSALLQI